MEDLLAVEAVLLYREQAEILLEELTRRGPAPTLASTGSEP